MVKVSIVVPMYLSKMLLRFARLSQKVSERLYMPPHKKMVMSWHTVNGDETLRLDYDLDQDSIVFDLGGYKGQWSSDIFSRYCCFIHCFEPVGVFADNIDRRFAQNRRIVVHRFALSNDNGKAMISHDRDSSSIFRGKGKEESRLVKATDFMKENNICRIDLMKLNIEGSEYDLLEHLIETGFVKNIINPQIQFHDFIPNARERMNNIQKT